MKKGRKPQDSTKRTEQMLQQVWSAQTLDLKIIEEFNLLNQFYPALKQISIIQSIQMNKRTSKVRYVRRLNNNAPLIDCRTRSDKLKEIEIAQIKQNQIEEENFQQNFQAIDSEENPNNAIIVISSDDSVICLNDIDGFNLENEISDHDDQYSKTQPQPRVSIVSNSRQQFQGPRYLQFEPINSSSSSFNFSQPLSASLIARFMNDENEVVGNWDEWSLSSLESKTPPIKNHEHQTTFNKIQNYFPSITTFQFESILQAYNHNYELILRILYADRKQIRLILEKNKKVKL